MMDVTKMKELNDYFWHKQVDFDRFGLLLWSLLVFVVGMGLGIISIKLGV